MYHSCHSDLTALWYKSNLSLTLAAGHLAQSRRWRSLGWRQPPAHCAVELSLHWRTPLWCSAPHHTAGPQGIHKMSPAHQIKASSKWLWHKEIKSTHASTEKHTCCSWTATTNNSQFFQTLAITGCFCVSFPFGKSDICLVSYTGSAHERDPDERPPFWSMAKDYPSFRTSFTWFWVCY